MRTVDVTSTTDEDGYLSVDSNKAATLLRNKHTCNVAHQLSKNFEVRRHEDINMVRFLTRGIEVAI